MTRIRAAVVGMGTMGVKHARCLRELDGVDVVAVVDLDVALAERQAREAGLAGVPVFQDYREMLERATPHCVAVATPDHVHVEPVTAALRAGAHVLVEKPLATSLEDCTKIIDVAAQTGRTVMTNFSHRWMLPYAATEARVRAGDLGTIRMAYARKDDTLEVIRLWPWLAAHSSCAAYLSSHDLDLVCSWTRSPVVDVYARGVKGVLAAQGYDTYDAIQASVRFAQGAIGVFESAWIYPAPFPTMTDSYISLVGTEGTVTVDRRREGIELCTSRGLEWPKLTIHTEVAGRLVGGFRDSVAHFVTCVRTGQRPAVSLASSWHVAAVVEAIHESLRTGRTVTVQALGRPGDPAPFS